jgi:GntR family transcriptional regulator/MocR family aminotransferase
LADAYNIPVLEDDFAAELRYDGRVQPALKALDPGGRVIYVGTFSKSLMPGLRIGYLIADGPVYGLLGQLKRITDLLSSSLIQRALESFVTVGRYQAHVRRLCRVYRRRRDVMLEAIGRYLPAGSEFVAPQGGLYLWLRLPPELSSIRLLPYAAAEGVQYTAGPRLFPRPEDGTSFLQLNFARQPPELIDTGMRRLGRALERLAAAGS